jgi:Na+-transporting methylmalonyl-CoA/oxaloacetate decarboxylase gamma subunit
VGGQISNEMAILSVTGAFIVFCVLAMIALVVTLFKRLDDHWQKQEEDKAEQALVQEQNIDDTTLLLIAAACATVVGGRFRVRRIHRLLSPKRRRTPWSAQGRLILQGSHTVKRNRDSR